jgi:hypothetical protein
VVRGVKECSRQRGTPPEQVYELLAEFDGKFVELKLLAEFDGKFVELKFSLPRMIGKMQEDGFLKKAAKRGRK